MDDSAAPSRADYVERIDCSRAMIHAALGKYPPQTHRAKQRETTGRKLASNGFSIRVGLPGITEILTDIAR
jgi:hypothetical protein